MSGLVRVPLALLLVVPKAVTVVLLVLLGVMLGAALAVFIGVLTAKDQKSRPSGASDEMPPLPDEEPDYIGQARLVDVPWEDPDEALPEVVTDLALMDDATDRQYWERFAQLESLSEDDRMEVLDTGVRKGYLTQEQADRLLATTPAPVRGGTSAGNGAARNATLGFYDEFADSVRGRDLGGVFDEEFVMAPLSDEIRRMMLGPAEKEAK